MSDTTNSAALAEIEALIAACEEDFCNAVTEDPEYGCDDDESVGGGDLGDASVKFRHIRRARSVLRRLAETNASTFQARVHPWLLTCFGAEIAANREERNHRFLEEALELVQALDCTRSEAHQLVDYVFGRPDGEPAQEVGGVMVTLAALCLASSLDMHEAGEIELARIWTKVEQIRAKQAAKPKNSPLPQHVEPAATPAEVRELIDAAIESVEKPSMFAPIRLEDIRDQIVAYRAARADAVLSALTAAGYLTTPVVAGQTVGPGLIAVPVESRVQHIKRRSTYQIFPEATAQVSTGSFNAGRYRRWIEDGQPLTVYRCETDGRLWVRFPDEMQDGRFTALTKETGR